MVKFKRLFTVIAFSVVLNACQSIGEIPTSLKTPLPPLKMELSEWAKLPFKKQNIASPYELTNAQRRDFLTYFHHPLQANTKPHKRLYNYLEQFVSNFSYLNETYSSSDALNSKSGNCMSLALVTTSLAELAGLEIKYQMLSGAPLFYAKGKSVFVSQHIRTKVYAVEEPKSEDMMYFGKTHLVIDYYKNQADLSGHHISKAEFISMYFSNLAAEHYAKGELLLAYELSANAMSIYPNSPENINTHSLIIKELFSIEEAIKLLTIGYERQLSSLNLMSNLKLFLIRTGQNTKALKVSNNIKSINDPNPYQWLKLGNELYEKKQLTKAMSYFEKAKELAPYLDEVYLAQAKVQFKLGNKKLAKMNLIKAMEAPIKVNEVSLYQAKLSAFTSNSGL
ncbi:tetratricopeptide repeat protein [Psychrosphaera haliotis]|uniref:Uncharacterized protein n=1 Tax=Psychrosphaera haliotis TaxID=555083 RepID=A0A6N8F5F9_9GAMM|nr:hypothetical protein [Psychrosphaera haliotis]MUH71886.1 hypothetical protein [Psychrosphaera haliotis]